MVFSLASNVYQKKLSNSGLHPFYIVAATYFVLSLLATPFLHVLQMRDLANSFWLSASLASFFDVVGWMFLVLSLSKTDFSVFGPLNAYKVVISMLLSMLFLHEIPSFQGFSGVLIIVIGSFFLMPPTPAKHTRNVTHLFFDKGVQARFLSILMFSIGTIFLKKSVEEAGALETMIFWSLFGLPLALIANYFFLPSRIQHEIKVTKRHLHTVFSVGVMVFIMQYLTLLLLETMLVAYALALFQFGMVIQVLIGYQIFNEKEIRRKLLASIVMMLGSVLVLIA